MRAVSAPTYVFPSLKLFTTQSQLLMTLTNRPFENIVGKGENAGYQQMLVTHNVFCPSQKKYLIFLSLLFLSSANAFNLDQSQILLLGKEFIHHY